MKIYKHTCVRYWHSRAKESSIACGSRF